MVRDAEEKLGISEALLRPILVRLQRSGCYEEFTGAYLDYTGGKGRSTELYRRLERAAGRITNATA